MLVVPLMRLLAAFCALFLASCSTNTGPGDQRDFLERNRLLWSRAGIPDYRYTVTRLCGCDPGSLGPVVVEVYAGEIAERRYATGAPVDPQFEELFRTVPGFFELIEQALDQEAAGLSARYHRRYGFPVSIQIDWVAGIVDDEVSYHITNFAPIQTP